MNINEISKITHVNKETIRMYRKEGLLRPKVLENGYYSYSSEDVLSILTIRRFRNLDMSLESIKAQFHNSTEHTDIKEVEKQIEETEKLQKEIEIRMASLKIQKSHLQSVHESKIGIVREEVYDSAKYDFYPTDGKYDLSEEDLDKWFKYIHITTTPIRIDKKYLNEECKDKIIPIQMGKGTYKEFIDLVDLVLPAKHETLGPGQYLSIVVIVNNVKELDAEMIRPLKEYAKKNHYTFLTSTTAFLIKVVEEKDRTDYYFRIRALVKKK